MAALIGADFQQLGRDDAVKPRPIGLRHGVMHLAGHRRHQRHAVGFAFGQRPDCLDDVLHSIPQSAAVFARIRGPNKHTCVVNQDRLRAANRVWRGLRLVAHRDKLGQNLRRIAGFHKHALGA